MKLYLFINELFNHALCYFEAVTSNEWIRVIAGSGKEDDDSWPNWKLQLGICAKLQRN